MITRRPPWPAIVFAVTVALVGFGCATAQPVVRVNHDPPAPLDPEIARLPGAAAHWMSETIYGGRLYVVEAGRDVPGGTPLFLVHGLGESGVRDFYPVFAQLARTRRVVAFDLPGFGRSGRANLKYEPVGYAGVLAEIIARYADGPVDVMGHSMGAAVAIEHAGTFPRQVRRLIVVDAAGILHREAFVGEHVSDATSIASALFPSLTEKVRGLASAVVAEVRRHEPPARLVLQNAILRDTFLRGDPGRIAALGLVLHDFGPALSGISAPTLIVWGDHDTTASLRTARLLTDRIRSSRLVVLSGVGHVPMLDAPGDLVARANDHLQGAVVQAAAANGPSGSGAAGHFPTDPATELSHGKGFCDGTDDLRFSGVYDEITLDHCARALLEGVRVGRVTARESSVELSSTQIGGGIVASQSNIVMTGGSVAGEIAFDLDGSRLDLAGVAIDGVQEAIHVRGNSRVLFSVCPIRTSVGTVHAHGAQTLSAGQAWRVPTAED